MQIDAKMIERGLKKTGKSKGGLAAAMGVRPGAVSEIFSGIRLIKASEIEPISEYLRLNWVPIMGRVGAGAVIEPEYEQVPPDGLGEVELPFPTDEESIACAPRRPSGPRRAESSRIGANASGEAPLVRQYPEKRRASRGAFHFSEFLS